MASPFETESTILTQEQANHINERHVFITKHVRTSKFWLRFTLLELLECTGEPDSEGVELLQEGWKEGHGHFYLYVFAVDQEIGRDPEDFPAHHVAIYCSEKVKGEKWNTFPTEQDI